ncbi:hypothetical protein PCASD_15931 [Puccinia coronata f. sp. avenae]|uniref:Uncharacterized protein n=1 Tax=Puccinia coronata f. sp. avenae TaxID=200324 RepID=A0A2N5UEY4_9BASI|nr:hypothetical protein PCASD_15931 [Puccinia coronata f. sp. avenae]
MQGPPSGTPNTSTPTQELSKEKTVCGQSQPPTMETFAPNNSEPGLGQPTSIQHDHLPLREGLPL